MEKAAQLDPKASVWEELGFLVYDHLRMDKKNLKSSLNDSQHDSEILDLNAEGI